MSDILRKSFTRFRILLAMREMGELPICLKSYNKEAQEAFKSDLARYLKAYPFLNEPVSYDMLCEALLIKIALQAEHELMNAATDDAERARLQKNIDSMQRTLTLYFNRLGITYVSRQRRKLETKFKTAFERGAEDSNETNK